MPWRCMGLWRYSSTILNVSTKLTWVVSFAPQLHYPQVNSLWHLLYGWVGPRASLDTMEKRKISRLCQESNRSLSVIQPVTQLLYWLSCPGPPRTVTAGEILKLKFPTLQEKGQFKRAGFNFLFLEMFTSSTDDLKISNKGKMKLNSFKFSPVVLKRL
jgi:hypothetical protein